MGLFNEIIMIDKILTPDAMMKRVDRLLLLLQYVVTFSSLTYSNFQSTINHVYRPMSPGFTYESGYHYHLTGV